MKKVLSIVIALCMMCSLVPALGAEAYGATKLASTKAMAANDSLKEAKGFVAEYIDETYEEYVKSKSMYIDDIWNEIQKSYDAAMKKVNAAKKKKDLYSTDGLFIELAPAIDKEVSLMAKFGGLIKHYVKSKNDLKVMKRDLGYAIKTYKSMLKKKDYNDFYWGRLQNLFYDANVSLGKIKNFRDYLILADVIYGKLGQAASAYMPEWLEEIVISFDDEEDSILIPLIPEATDDGWIIIEEDEMGPPIYNKVQVEAARLEVVEKLNLYVDNQLTMAKSKADKDKLKEEIQKYKTSKLDKIEDVDAIYAAGDKKLSALIKKTGVACPDITVKDFIKVAKEYNALTSKYSQYEYSDSMWLMVEATFTATKDIIMNATKKYEVYGVLKDLKEALKIIPKAKKEFNDLKSRTVKKLKSYTNKKNRKKYSQGKVKTVVKNGIAALNKVEKYDVNALQEKCDFYIKKADGCIKKFLIKTSKKGKGTITKSKKVKYGGKCVIKITPKAGYKIKSVRIDGKKKKLKNAYTFKKVTRKHRVRVVFGK